MGSKEAEKSYTIEELVFLAANAAEDKKAIDTKIIDIRSLTDFTDYMVVASGDSAVQLKAIANSVEDKMAELDMEPSHSEGKHGGKWILYDYDDFVVHIIADELREFYKLEEFWGHGIFISQDEWMHA